MKVTIFAAVLGVGILMRLSPHPALADSEELERSARALELYLQDKKEHKKHCPEIEWDQPSLDEYKANLKSHLPEDCKE